MTFKSYCKNWAKKGADGPLKDFADDFSRDRDNKNRTFKTWAELKGYLIYHNAIPEALKAGEKIFKRWLKKEPVIKPKTEKLDGLSPKEVDKLVRQIRQVWAWSTPRRLCLKRAEDAKGFSVCEKCKKKVPKVYPDHVTPVGPPIRNGKFDGDYIMRMWCPSKFLQALCKSCHAEKTKLERKARELEEIEKGFY